MPQNSGAVRVGQSGRIWFVPKGTSHTPPTNAIDPIQGAVDLGLTTEDGVTVNRSSESEEIRAWQRQAPVRRIQTSTTTTFSFTLLQLDRSTFTASMGGKVTEPTPGNFLWTPDNDAQVEGALYIDVVDGALKYRYALPSAAQTGEVEMQFVNSDATTLPTEWTALTPDDGTPEIQVFSNDPNLGEPGAYPAWKATTAYTVGTRTKLASGQVLEATVAGTSAATAPTAPAAVGGTVVDGTTTWKRVS